MQTTTKLFCHLFISSLAQSPLVQIVWNPALGTRCTSWPSYRVRQDKWPSVCLWEASAKPKVLPRNSQLRSALQNASTGRARWFCSFFKMKNYTEMIVSLLLKILINDYSLNPSKRAMGRLLLSAAPNAPSCSTDPTAFWHHLWKQKRRQRLEKHSVQMQVMPNWAFSLRGHLFSLSTY